VIDPADELIAKLEKSNRIRQDTINLLQTQIVEFRRQFNECEQLAKSAQARAITAYDQRDMAVDEMIYYRKMFNDN